MAKKQIGVLGLQGDFSRHAQMVQKCGNQAKIIKSPNKLTECDGLILPGGESTTLNKLLLKTGLFEAIQKYNQNHPIMGTCAGLIILATQIVEDQLKTLGLIDLGVKRNAYGRQVDSFFGPVNIPVFQENHLFEGIFIRAPKIITCGKNTINLGFYQDSIVMVRNQQVLATTFHPELTNDCRIHTYFFENFF